MADVYVVVPAQPVLLGQSGKGNSLGFRDAVQGITALYDIGGCGAFPCKEIGDHQREAAQQGAHELEPAE